MVWWLKSTAAAAPKNKQGDDGKDISENGEAAAVVVVKEGEEKEEEVAAVAKEEKPKEKGMTMFFNRSSSFSSKQQQQVKKENNAGGAGGGDNVVVHPPTPAPPQHPPRAWDSLTSSLIGVYNQRFLPLEKHCFWEIIGGENGVELKSGDVARKPVVVVVGPCNSGKSTAIGYLLNDPQWDSVSRSTSSSSPSSSSNRACFVAIADEKEEELGEEEKSQPVLSKPRHRLLTGEEALKEEDLPFHGFKAFGAPFLSRFKVVRCKSPVLARITFIEVAGALLQSEESIDVCRHLFEFADLILFIDDAGRCAVSSNSGGNTANNNNNNNSNNSSSSNNNLAGNTIKTPTATNNSSSSSSSSSSRVPGSGEEDIYLRHILRELCPHIFKLRIILNKADSVNPLSLLTSHSNILWKWSKFLIESPAPPKIYYCSLRDAPLRQKSTHPLISLSHSELLRELFSLPSLSAQRRVNALLSRGREVVVSAYTLGYIRKEVPSFFGKDKKQWEMIANLDSVFTKVALQNGLHREDFPDVDKLRAGLVAFCKSMGGFDALNRLNLSLIEGLEKGLSHEIPLLFRQYQLTADDAAFVFDPTALAVLDEEEKREDAKENGGKREGVEGREQHREEKEEVEQDGKDLVEEERKLLAEEEKSEEQQHLVEEEEKRVDGKKEGEIVAEEVAVEKEEREQHRVEEEEEEANVRQTEEASLENTNGANKDENNIEYHGDDVTHCDNKDPEDFEAERGNVDREEEEVNAVEFTSMLSVDSEIVSVDSTPVAATTTLTLTGAVSQEQVENETIEEEPSEVDNCKGEVGTIEDSKKENGREEDASADKSAQEETKEEEEREDLQQQQQQQQNDSPAFSAEEGKEVDEHEEQQPENTTTTEEEKSGEIASLEQEEGKEEQEQEKIATSGEEEKVNAQEEQEREEEQEKKVVEDNEDKDDTQQQQEEEEEDSTSAAAASSTTTTTTTTTATASKKKNKRQKGKQKR